ncbi:MAG: SAM-dependent methyltransferase, partial [Deltaproteobacteria bacterium]|nr:SAM-dependent methyltransferase [Deltaproteobacteria bacterium]
LMRHRGEIWFGLDDEDLPAAQGFVGNSNLLVAPAWRLPRELVSFTPAVAWIRERLSREYGVNAEEIWELGGRYYPSLGVTPEVVYPLAVEVQAERRAERKLSWVRLSELVRERHRLADGHLRIVVGRAAHALGL